MIDFSKVFIKLLDVHTTNWIKLVKINKLNLKNFLFQILSAYIISFSLP